MKELPQYSKIWRGQPVSLADVRIESPHVIPAIAGLIDKGDLVGKGFFDFDDRGNISTDVLIFHRKFIDNPIPRIPLTHEESEKKVDKWMRVANAPRTTEYALKGIEEETVELFDAKTNEELAHEAGDLIIRLHQLIIITGYQVEPIIEATLRKLYTKYPPHIIAQGNFTNKMREQKQLWGK